MLTKTKMQEIQDLKLQGYTKADIIRYYEAQGRKPPSRPTISKEGVKFSVSMGKNLL